MSLCQFAYKNSFLLRTWKQQRNQTYPFNCASEDKLLHLALASDDLDSALLLGRCVFIFSMLSDRIMSF